MNQWTSESLNHWFGESMIDGQMNQWITESMNPCIHESMNQSNEVMDGWMDGWMSEWMDGWTSYLTLLSYIFTERPLAGASLLSATSLNYFCSELPPTYLFCSLCNPTLLFAQLLQWVWQPPAAILLARSPAATVVLCCAQPCRSFAPNQPMFTQRLQWRWFRAAPTCQAFSDFYNKLCSRDSLVHILPTSSSKSAPNVTIFQHFQVQIELSLRPVHFLLTTFPDRAPKPETETLLRDPGSHITRKNHRVWHPRAFSPVNSHVPGLSLSSTAPTRKWWYDVDMMMTRLPLDIRP